MSDQPIRFPDLSARPHELSCERVMSAPPGLLYAALTQGFDIWFAAQGSLLMKPAVNEPFFFETEHAGLRYPHYGRFLRLEPERLVQMTWVTGADGTEGAETVVTMELLKQPRGIRLRLRHEGFPNAQARDRHEAAWPLVLEQLDRRTGAVE